jgi:hypothetical protein
MAFLFTTKICLPKIWQSKVGLKYLSRLKQAKCEILASVGSKPNDNKKNLGCSSLATKF